MNNELIKNNVIKKEDLCSELYFQSLLEQGYLKGLLSDSDIERIQNDCLAFLAYKVKLYNGYDRSSIRVEKAQEIMTSNMFTIGLWLKTYKNPDDAIIAIQNDKITELYNKGRKRIDTMVMAAKAVHSQIVKRLVDTKNVFYKATIVDGINGFFKLYYPDYGAHEIHITADYPVFYPIPKLLGIEFIHEYLNALYYENRFCSYFSTNEIHYLLSGYEENYQELLINIYELILSTAIGCVIVGTDVHTLDISDVGVEYLYILLMVKQKTKSMWFFKTLLVN